MGAAISQRRESALQQGFRRTGGRPSAPVPYLRLVGPFDSAGTTTAPIPSQRRPDVSETVHPVRRAAPIRLTRRGRIVLWLLLAAAALAVVVLLAPASQAADPAGPPRAVTVHAGDTMWSIATKALPGVDPATAMARVRELNHLADNQVYVGEQILVPPTNS